MDYLPLSLALQRKPVISFDIVRYRVQQTHEIDTSLKWCSLALALSLSGRLVVQVLNHVCKAQQSRSRTNPGQQQTLSLSLSRTHTRTAHSWEPPKSLKAEG